MIRRTKRTFAAAALVTLGTLAACSDDDTPAVSTVASEPGASADADDVPESTAPVATTPATTSDSATATSGPATTLPPPTTTPNAVISIVNQPGEGEFEGALQDVSDIGCAAADGTWTSSGTVTNPTEGSASYRIFVSFLDGAGSTVALIETNVDELGPGETGEFAVDFASDATDLTCVLRVERRAA